MKNWKKLLACMLAGVLALAVFTACTGTIATAKLQRATQENTAELRQKLGGLAYDENLNDDAYAIANWIAAKQVSLKATDDGLERVETTDAVSLTLLEQGRLADAIEYMGSSIVLDSDLVIGLQYETNMYANQVVFTVPFAVSAPQELQAQAAGKTKVGIAYILYGDNTYVVTVFQ